MTEKGKSKKKKNPNHDAALKQVCPEILFVTLRATAAPQPDYLSRPGPAIDWHHSQQTMESARLPVVFNKR